MELWSNLGTIMASVIFIRSIAKEYLPPEFNALFSKWMRTLIGIVSSYISVVIDENDGMKVSEVYEAVQTYLSVRSSSAAKRLKLKKRKNNKEFTFSMDSNEQIEEEYEGIKVWWVFQSSERKQQIMFWHSGSDEKRCYVLKFHKKHKEKIFDEYLPHVMAEAQTLENRSRYRKIYTNQSSRDNEYRNRVWTPVVFDHPATFGTLALEPDLKKDIMEDLQRFTRGEKYYRQVGRAWKRGYLLHGPPGTGKSSMIAAMANFLEYDIYDLELTQVKNNTELRKLLIHTANKSIIVIEDIDCSLDLSDRKKKKKSQKDAESKDEKPPEPGKPDESETNEDSKVTLSGVLNFTDGLWSCCGSERLFVFTTNHIERLDPALLRSGRMDKHILLSFCTFEAFRILASNYLGIQDHELFPEIQDLMEAAQMTPADVTEHLMKRSDNPTLALRNLFQALGEAKEKRATTALNDCISEENASAAALNDCISEENASATVEGQE